MGDTRVAGPQMSRSLCIDVVIPVYNEKENIERTLESLAANTRHIDADFTVTIVYDLDEDDTLPVIRKVERKYPYRICTLKNERREYAMRSRRASSCPAQTSCL